MTSTSTEITFPDDLTLIAALRNGDESAFMELVERYHMALVRLALIYVNSQAVAEEVAQETWLGVLKGIHTFEGRSSLKTWLFRILTNRAKTRAQREGRYVASLDADDDEPAVDPERFRQPDPASRGEHWAVEPTNWDEIPEARLLAQETRTLIQQAIAALPPQQAEVITLRDVEGWSSEEVCNILDISETNQRVLLHRARSKVRRALEQYFED